VDNDDDEAGLGVLSTPKEVLLLFIARDPRRLCCCACLVVPLAVEEEDEEVGNRAIEEVLDLGIPRLTMDVSPLALVVAVVDGR